jgi:subtilisin family serine protease
VAPISGQIVIADPPKGLTKQLHKFGLRKIAGTHLRTLDVNILVLRIIPGRTVNSVLKALREAYPGIIVDKHHAYDSSSAGSAKGLGFPIKMIGWGRVPQTCGQGVKVGMIDTAVDASHPSLCGRIIIQRHFLTKNKQPSDPTHGTAVAAILVGRSMPDGTTGLLPSATLYAANIFERVGKKGKRGTMFGILKGLDWLATTRVHVVNMSIAGPANGVFRYVIQKGIKKGMVLVAAAGNVGPRAKPAWPAAHPLVASITAIDRRMSIYRYANRGAYIDFAAPGVNVPSSTRHGRTYKTGTSFAAPYIAAMTALMVSQGRQRDMNVLRKKLKRYVIDLGKPGRDSIFGWGMVRAKPPC